MKDRKSDYARVRSRRSMTQKPYRCKKNERIYIDKEKGVLILTLKTV